MSTGFLTGIGKSGENSEKKIFRALEYLHFKTFINKADFQTLGVFDYGTGKAVGCIKQVQG